MGATFEAPGPGRWELDRSHFPGGTTPIAQWLMSESMQAGMSRVFADQGVPARSLADPLRRTATTYTRLVPLIGGDKPPKKLPPECVLRVATRVHPEFRKRTRTAPRRWPSVRGTTSSARGTRDAAAPDGAQPRVPDRGSGNARRRRSSPTINDACSPTCARRPSSTSGCTGTTSVRSPATCTPARRGGSSRPRRWTRSPVRRRRRPRPLEQLAASAPSS